MKLYLPIFFLFIFSGKVLVLDSALQVLAPESPGIKMHKPLCNKKRAKRSPQTSFLKQEKEPKDLINIQLICHQNFWFENTTETEVPFLSNFRRYLYFAPPELDIHLPKLYPPPKLFQTV